QPPDSPHHGLRSTQDAPRRPPPDTGATSDRAGALDSHARQTLCATASREAVAQTTGVVRRTQSRVGVFETGLVCGLLRAFDPLAGLIWLGPPDGVCSILTRNLGRRHLCDSLA